MQDVCDQFKFVAVEGRVGHVTSGPAFVSVAICCWCDAEVS